MRIEDLHHLLAAAAQIADEEEWVVVGSQAILGTDAEAPPEMLRSMEADLYPRAAPDKAILIEGVLGDGSRFHEANGYYAHAVGPETAKAPAGWEDRLVRIDVPPRGRSIMRVVAPSASSGTIWSCPSSQRTVSATGNLRRTQSKLDWSSSRSSSSELTQHPSQRSFSG